MATRPGSKLDRRSEYIGRLAPAAVVGALVVVVYLTISPFLPAIIWGAVVAIAIDPWFRWLVRKLDGRRLLSAWIVGVLLAGTVVIPALGLAAAMLNFLPNALSWTGRLSEVGPTEPPAILADLPAIGPQVTAFWHDLTTDASHALSLFRDEIKTGFLWLLGEVEIFGVFVGEFAIGILLAVVFLYAGDHLTSGLDRFFNRLGGSFAQEIARDSARTARQTVIGVLGAALVQTLVATIAFLVVSVPNWMLLAGVMFMLALIQIGPLLIFVPLAIWLWADGHGWQAAYVLFWGIVVVGLADNIVRPMIASKGGDVPASLAFLGALGGFTQWGVIGVFIGPVILAVGYEVASRWSGLRADPQGDALQDPAPATADRENDPGTEPRPSI
ncbi:AI-2E family transporter [Neoaquamicrobium sediminum]|uniref:AI-2E family transporter n=3 Tax=Neoaquamicrobium sediminum TaxID=1849104 RepID=UPI0036180D23